jgi:hypothetical protein
MNYKTKHQNTASPTNDLNEAKDERYSQQRIVEAGLYAECGNDEGGRGA